MRLPNDYLVRDINVGFSGGEKKKAEIVQLVIHDPEILLLDEIDSGLDVDAINLIANEIKSLISKRPRTLIMVSHYARFYDLIKPNKCFVINKGKIIKTGGYEVIQKIDQEGYG
jgi:Fe-S cluster assembly ATP-binding protein